MGIRATTLLPVVGVGAFVGGVLVGMWVAGGGGSEGRGGAGGSEGGKGGGGAGLTGRGMDGASGDDGVGGIGSGGGGATRGAPGDSGSQSSSGAGIGSGAPSGSSDSGSTSSTSPGAIPRGTSTGRPASTSVTEEEEGEEDPSTEDATAESGTSSPSSSSSSSSRSGALPPYTLPERIAGRIADALTGKVPPGAAVSLRWELSDGTVSSSVSANVAADGTFSLEPREPMRESMARMIGEGGWLRDRFRSVEEGLAGLEYTLAGSAPGYTTLLRGDPGPETDLLLVPEPLDPLPGWVRVEARRADGSRFPGRMLVDFLSGDRGTFSQWALPEADGSFLLPGVPAGEWSVRAAGKHDGGRKVRVPEAGEARVEVTVPRAGLEEPGGVPAGEPREVVVALPGRSLPGGTCLRAEARGGCFFRVEAAAGAGTFPALPAGRWTFVIQSPGRPEERFAAEIPPGAGTHAVEFPPPAAEGGGGGR